MHSKNFSNKELMCKCGCGTNELTREAVDKLQELRDAIGRPLVLNSAFRCKNHPIEAAKSKPGYHNSCAFDIRVSNGAEAYEIMKLAFEMGWTGIALGKGFVHVDCRKATPVSWMY